MSEEKLRLRISVLESARNVINGLVAIKDFKFTKSVLDAIEDGDKCTLAAMLYTDKAKYDEEFS